MGAADPHAAADVLRTERNAAVAEAKLWLRRLLEMQRERDEARAEWYDADKCLAAWQASHAELLRDFRRLEVKLGNVLGDLESADFLLEHLDPYLPRWLQTYRRADNELLYVQLAPCRADDAGPE